MTQRFGFGSPDQKEPEVKSLPTLIRCDECHNLTRGVYPALVNSAGQVSQRTVAEKWLCGKCLTSAGILIGDKKENECDDPKCMGPNQTRAQAARAWLKAAYSKARGAVTT